MPTRPAAPAARHPSALRRALGPLLREARIAYLHWAQREIHPLHDDVPRIVMDIARLKAQRNGGAA